MRIESPLLYFAWLFALSCIFSSVSGQGDSEFNYQDLEPCYAQEFSSGYGDKRVTSMEYSPYGMSVRLGLRTGWSVLGELLYVDENTVYLAQKNGKIKPYLFSEITFVQGKFGRIRLRTVGLQSLATITTIAGGLAAIVTIPVNLIIASTSNMMTKRALQFKSSSPQQHWVLLRSYSRYPAGLKNERQTAPVKIQF